MAETHDKCMYCESKVTAVYTGDVEHILPKAIYPHLYVEWTNLGYACSICNNAKGTNEGFINPYVQEPADHLMFFGPMILYDPADQATKLTVDGIRLNRVQLIERRAAAIKRLMDQMELKQKADGALRDIIQQQIEDSLAAGGEYSGTLLAFYTEMSAKGD